MCDGLHGVHHPSITHPSLFYGRIHKEKSPLQERTSDFLLPQNRDGKVMGE